MSHLHTNTERNCPSINVSAVTLDIDAFIANVGSDPELKESLQNASVLILPTDLRPQHDGPAFPEITFEVLEYLQEQLGDTASVEALADDNNCPEIAYRSDDVFLPLIFVAKEVLVPLVVPLLNSFLMELMSRRRRHRSELNVESEIFYTNEAGKVFSIKYSGPADTYEQVVLQCLHDPGSLPRNGK